MTTTFKRWLGTFLLFLTLFGVLLTVPLARGETLLKSIGIVSLFLGAAGIITGFVYLIVWLLTSD
jgi:hypothetical protein